MDFFAKRYGEAAHCLAAGRDDYFSKPVQQAERLRCPEGEEGGRFFREDRMENNDSGPAFDPKTALDQLGGDEEFLGEVIRLFRQDGTQLLGEVRAAVARGDAGGLRGAAHALKGSAGYVGARPTEQAAQRLETIGARGDLAEAADAFADLEREFGRLLAALPESAPQSVL
jgi:two-component system, sensor histidine kinase and response regulator